MKQKIILFVMMLIINNLYSDDFDGFRKLSAREKIQKILEEYRYDRNWSRRLRFSQYASILTEEPEENIPVLFEYFENFRMLPLSENDMAFYLIDSILWRSFHMNNNLLNQDELNRLAAIYQGKIYDYLETYKVIDVNIFLAETTIELIRNNRDIFFVRNIGQILYEKYTKLGYNDLRLVYEPIQEER